MMVQVDNVLLEDASMSCSFEVQRSVKKVVIGPPGGGTRVPLFSAVRGIQALAIDKWCTLFLIHTPISTHSLTTMTQQPQRI